METDYEGLRRQVSDWVRRAGDIARDYFGRVAVESKADASPVTEADRAVQEALQEAVARAYPADAVVTEEIQRHPERHGRPASARRCWVIDPIDGTRNYARAIPVFSISVALLVEGRPVVGVVADPFADQVYSAVAGGGLRLNDAPVVARPAEHVTGLLVGSPTGQKKKLPTAVHRWIDRYNIRNLGSTALHLAYLAAGGLDAVLVTECHAWDIAGAWTMLEEAGILVRPLDGALPFPMDVAAGAGREISFFAAWPAVMEQLWPDLAPEAVS